MRNLKRALSLTLASVMLLGMMVIGTSAAAGYSDVDEDDNVEAIEVLQAIEVMVGDDRGFGPDRPVNRAEMAVVMGLLLNLDYNYYVSTCPFADVSGNFDWAKGWVGACAANGIVSGRGEGIYDPAATVTAVEAASMMMRALGYFRYQNDYADGFMVSTVRQGTKIGIFEGVGSDGSTPMTRNQVAQMALNALKTGMVEPDGQTINLTTPDGQIYTGKVNYVNVTSRKDFAYAISDVEATSIGSQNSGAIVELGEQLFNGNLELNDDARDDFGRPAREWKFKGNEIGTYVKKELIRKEWTTEVTGKDLYDEITKSVLDDKNYDKNVYIDGQDDSDVNEQLFELTATTLRNNKDGVGATGNGVLTQLFIDPKSGNDRDQKDVTVAIINTYLARARADYNEKKDEVDFNVYGIDETNIRGEYEKFIDARENNDDNYEILTVTGDDFTIEDIKKDNTFLVTVAQGDIQTIVEPEVISAATMTSFKKNSNVVVNGTKYDYSDAAEWNYKVLDRYTGSGRENLKDKKYDVYLDKYGYAIGIDLVDEVDNYIFITGVDDALSNRYAKNIEASGIFLDGTMKEITYNSTDSSNILDNIESGNNHYGLVNTWCTYTVDKNGIYTLKQVAKAIDDDHDVAQTWDKTIAGKTIDKKNLDLENTNDTNYKRVYGNDNTVYLNASVKTINVDLPQGDWHGIIDDVDSVITGIDNVSLDVYKHGLGSDAANYANDSAAKKADENGKITVAANKCEAVAYGAYALYDDDGYIIAAVTVADDGSTSDNWVYVTSGSVTEESYDSDAEEWTWSREVALDGVETEISYKGDALKYLDEMKKYNWYEVKYKGDGNVKSVTLAVDALAHAANGTGTTQKDDKYEGNIHNLEYTVQNGKDTILYEASGYEKETPKTIGGATGYGAFLNEAGQPYLNSAKTFYVSTSVNQGEGFRIKDSTKVVFIQTNKNKETIDWYEGPEKLEDVVKNLNKGIGATDTDGKYNYEVSAVLDGNVARVVVVRDLNRENGTSVLGGDTQQYTVSVDGSTNNMTYTVSDGTTTVNNTALSVAKGANVTVTFEAAAGYVFTENNRSTITRTVNNVTKNVTVDAPEVKAGVENITLKVELDDSIEYIKIGSETYGEGSVITDAAGKVLVIEAWKNGSKITSNLLAQLQSTDSTDRININANAASQFIVTLKQNGTLYVTADADDIAEVYFKDAKERIESRTFTLYYKVTEPCLNRGGGIQYFENALGQVNGKAWSTVNPYTDANGNGVAYRYNKQVEAAALTEFLNTLTTAEGDGYTLDQTDTSSPIGITGDPKYWGEQVGPTKVGNKLQFTRKVAVFANNAGTLDPTDEIGQITVKYELVEIDGTPDDWKAPAAPDAANVDSATTTATTAGAVTIKGTKDWAEGTYRLYINGTAATANGGAATVTITNTSADKKELKFTNVTGLTTTETSFTITYSYGQRDESPVSGVIKITPTA